MAQSAKSRLEKAQKTMLGKYGEQAINLGGSHYRLNVVPTGSLMLDYKTGIGGFPYGHAVEIFGENRLGKSSAVGYPTLGNVQKQGKLPAIIASEPRLVTPQDKEWALKLGFDPDEALIQYPDHVEEAADMLRSLVFGNLVDYIMVDSLGGLGTPSGAQEGGKQKAYGISGAVTSVLNDIMPRLYKNNIGLMVINQRRQSGSFNGTILFDSPGGEGLHHHMRMRIQIKPGKSRYMANIDGENIMVGRELTCQFKKNNMAEGGEKSASFDFYHIETSKYGFGIDKAQDIINVGKITGVIKGSGHYEHPSFPENKSGERKIHGIESVGEFLLANPKAMEHVRNDVMKVMIQKNLEAGEAARDAALNADVVSEAEKSDDE